MVWKYTMLEVHQLCITFCTLDVCKLCLRFGQKWGCNLVQLGRLTGIIRHAIGLYSDEVCGPNSRYLPLTEFFWEETKAENYLFGKVKQQVDNWYSQNWFNKRATLEGSFSSGEILVNSSAIVTRARNCETNLAYKNYQLNRRWIPLILELH